MALVGIVMGSDSDMPVMSKAADILEELGIDYEMTIISAHREPDVFFEYAKTAEEKGFKVMTPAEYVNTFGDPNSATFDSMVKENVILDLDLGKDGHKYVAVPGMGSVLEEAEIKKDWHKHAGSLVSTYQRDYLELRGNDVGRDKVIEKMNKYIDAISDDTKGFITKGTEAHNLSRMQVYAATDRMKIMTTMNTADNPLLQKAQVDGKSIADWIKEKVYYDYSFDSMEAFEKRGFFKQEYLDKMGMTREQMIEHLFPLFFISHFKI